MISSIKDNDLFDTIEVSLFFASHTEEFTCIHSNGKYQKDSKYSLYDLWPLVRCLSSQSNILEKPKTLSLKDSKEICYIHRWNQFYKQVIILKPSELNQIGLNKLRTSLERNDEFLSKKFLTYLNREKNETTSNI